MFLAASIVSKGFQQPCKGRTRWVGVVGWTTRRNTAVPAGPAVLADKAFIKRAFLL